MATSKIQREVSLLLSTHFGQYTIRENVRPDWLITPKGERLELDFYIEEPMIAIEVQGRQHYAFIPHFHKTYAGFKAQLSRDQAKREMCASNGVTLHEVVFSDEIFEIITRFCPEVQWPIQPKAAQQMQQAQERVWVKQYKNEIILQSFNRHKPTPKRLLHKLFLVLSRQVEHDEMSLKDQGRIESRLRALRQYQEVKGKVQFNEYEEALLKVAQILINE